MKKKISAVLAISIIASNSMPAINVFADEVIKEKAVAIEKQIAKSMTVGEFTLKSNNNFNKYNELFKAKVASIENNGNSYTGTRIENAIDGDINTHWETSKPNSNDFKNEVVLELEEVSNIDRVAYATRQDSAKGKGYPIDAKIYVSESGNDEDFVLAGSVTGSPSTGGMVEFKFDAVKAKKIKFVFDKAKQDYASASEFWIYKEDKVLDSMERLFTNDKKNELSDEFKSIEALNALEDASKGHPFYEDFKDTISDAKLLLEGNNVECRDANVFKFKDFGSEELIEYDKNYKIDIANISTNGGQWSANNSIDKAIDGDIETNWHSNSKNSDTHVNEVVMTLDKLETLDKVVYNSQHSKGFAKGFDIYVSKTLSGDTFTKVTTGQSEITKNSVAIQFNPTQARRVKFVFKNGNDSFALASEFVLYKQDTVMDSMMKLFTDDTKTEVSEEFRNLAKLEELEKEAKVHPFYNDYKEDISDAKLLLEGNNIEYTDAKVFKFKEFGSKELVEYDKTYKLPKESIVDISTNGRHWGDSTIDKAIDNNIETNWHSGDTNNANHKNEVIMTLDKLQTIDKVVYTNKNTRGFAKKFDIYVSKTLSGNTFNKVTSGSSEITKDSIAIQFNPTEARRIKFVFTEANENWAVASEFGLYKPDTTLDKMGRLFTNGLMNELNPEFKSLEAIEALENEVNEHAFSDEFMKIIDMAKDLLKSPDKYQSNVFELESRGDSIKESQKRKVWNFQDWQPTGIAVKSGEKIEVYVDAERNTPLPKLVFKQMDSQHNGQVVISLTSGKNEITIPELDSNELRPGTAKAGVLYTSNPYTAEQQIRNPKIRIVGGTSYPHFIKGIDSDEEVMEELREYNKKLKADPDLPDVFDVFSDKTLVNVKSTYALDWYTENNKLPSYTANKSDEVIKETMRYWGFDGSSEVNSDFNFRYISMVKWLDNGGFMNAGNGITGFNQAQQGGALNVNTGWGFMHEMGHNFDTGGRTIGEVTNNMLPLHFSMLKGERSKISEQNLWESKIFPKVSKEDYSNNEWYPESDRSLLTHIAPIWQLQLYDNTFWPNFERYFRENNIGGGSWENIHEAWAVAASDVLQLNLKEHFARHGFYVSEETAKHMEQYPAPTKKIWYLNDNEYLNKGEGFNNDVNCKVKTTLNEDSIKLDISIDKDNANSLLGYEIIRDGKVIGFTTKDTFTDTNITEGENHKYEVVAYDTQLNTAEGTIAKAHQPKLETVGGLTLHLNEEFDASDFVRATDYQGNELTNIKITDNVDNTRKGEYTVTYEVTDRDSVVKETMQVNVVSEYDYLSDSEWESVKTGDGTATRNKSIKGRTLGEIKDYEKGIRVHANGYVVYDLGEHNYDNFEVKVGVDMNLEAQDRSSITFKVIGDGQTLATTKVLKHEDNMQYINVPIKGVKELRIEVNDGGNGITSDHGIMVEPKLTTNNAKPKLTIPKSQIVEVGETLDDVAGKFTALDPEDGDITNNVVVTGKDEVNLNKPGRYTLTYTVTDEDGNTVEKSRVINVVHPDDINYLSDFEWESATTGWKGPLKDKSVSNNILKLTGEDNGEVAYEKGIGTHAHSEIVYDLTDKDATLFSTFIGVDRAMYNSTSSVEFKIYVDDELAYESGTMRAKDGQKYVELDIEGAKKLKLVATTAGDGKDADHANWADAKLYTINTDRVDTTKLTKTLEEAKKLNADGYTGESYEVLANSIAKAEALLKEENPSQEAIDAMTTELQESIETLAEINLEEVINVPDEYLVKALNKALNKDGNFTIGDMRTLEHLDIGYGVVSLEGLQYAKNLKTITGEGNEVKDLRPLSKLENLTEVNFTNQYVSVGELKDTNGVIKVNTEAYNRQGENVAKKVVVMDKTGKTFKEQDLDGTTKEVDLDVRDMQSGFYRVHVTFEDPELSGILLYMASI